LSAEKETARYPADVPFPNRFRRPGKIRDSAKTKSLSALRAGFSPPFIWGEFFCWSSLAISSTLFFLERKILEARSWTRDVLVLRSPMLDHHKRR